MKAKTETSIVLSFLPYFIAQRKEKKESSNLRERKIDLHIERKKAKPHIKQRWKELT